MRKQLFQHFFEAVSFVWRFKFAHFQPVSCGKINN
jgi:hypothetical protein